MKKEVIKAHQNKVVCVGGGGNAKVLIDIILMHKNYSLVGITEATGALFQDTINGIPIIGSDEVLPRLLSEGVTFAFISVDHVGNPKNKK